jgi:hypothetical protein
VEGLREAYFKDSNFIALLKQRFNQSGRQLSARASCISCGRDLFMVVAAKCPVEERLRDKWRGYLIDTRLHVTDSPYKCSDCDLIVLCNDESFQTGMAGTVPEVYRIAIPSWGSARLCSTLILRRCEIGKLHQHGRCLKQIVWINIKCIRAYTAWGFYVE